MFPSEQRSYVRTIQTPKIDPIRLQLGRDTQVPDVGQNEDTDKSPTQAFVAYLMAHRNEPGVNALLEKLDDGSLRFEDLKAFFEGRRAKSPPVEEMPTVEEYEHHDPELPEEPEEEPIIERTATAYMAPPPPPPRGRTMWAQRPPETPIATQTVVSNKHRIWGWLLLGIAALIGFWLAFNH